MAMDIDTRTTQAQMDVVRELLADVPNLVLHRMVHNLDGEWLNIYFTDSTGDWVRSIHKDGTFEETQ
jgi:hypothetical protein